MIKTRYAPSPTGYQHVGGARTALFNWLFAHKHGGQFILRIEDTDQVRSTAESAAGILSDLLWLGLNWDEGPVPGAPKNNFFQSMRLDLYNQYLNELIRQDRAYEAYETPQQLAAMRQQAEKQKKPFRYRRNMPGRAPKGNGPAVIRFEMPFETITFNDMVLGPISVAGDEHDDIVIRKSDGFPTYHFAVVIDDHDMAITHVIRAQEHLMNTPKHLGLYSALGWQPPEHAHVPLVVNMDNSKMSKRDKAKVARAALQNYLKGSQDAAFAQLASQFNLPAAAITDFVAKKTDDSKLASDIASALDITLPEIDVQDFRRSGYMADALLNFIALVGWSPGENREILTRKEMIDLFSLEGIGKTNGRFDRKKLLWMNGEYIRRASPDTLIGALKSFNEVTNYSIKHADDAMLRELLGMYQERMSTLSEMAHNSEFFFKEPVYDLKAVKKHIFSDSHAEQLGQIRAMLEPIAAWNKEQLAPVMEAIIAMGEHRGAAAQALRVAVSGGAVSPPLLETLLLLGRDKTLTRIDKALALPPIP
ncbi:MAG TPA: glutamate--tRNA ligase [Phycisphaerae bacterium]|nr:glutamate--tRNA ligase [Phycisphaerae bacterium]